MSNQSLQLLPYNIQSRFYPVIMYCIETCSGCIEYYSVFKFWHKYSTTCWNVGLLTDIMLLHDIFLWAPLTSLTICPPMVGKPPPHHNPPLLRNWGSGEKLSRNCHQEMMTHPPQTSLFPLLFHLSRQAWQSEPSHHPDTTKHLISITLWPFVAIPIPSPTVAS